MAVTADFNANFREGCSAGPCRAAGALHDCLGEIRWMDVFFHNAILAWLHFFCNFDILDRHYDRRIITTLYSGIRGHDQGRHAFWSQKDHFPPKYEAFYLHLEGEYLFARSYQDIGIAGKSHECDVNIDLGRQDDFVCRYHKALCGTDQNNCGGTKDAVCPGSLARWYVDKL